MKKILLAVSMLAAMAVVFGLPDLGMAGNGPPACTSDAECDDADACTTDTCVGGFCENTTINCDDGIACTNDSCDQATGCVFTPDDSRCDDTIACTNDSCDQATGCVFTPDDTNACSDGNICTDDACVSGACVGTADCTNDASCNLGSGPGCSAIEGLDVTTDLVNGNCFTGRIGTTGVSGLNPNGSPAQDSDGDGCTDSLEECINSALVGFCSDVDVDDCNLAPGDGGEDITYTEGDKSGMKNNLQQFTATFQDISNCAITQCSDQVDNEPAACVGGFCANGGAACSADGDCPPGDGLIDYPDDPECDSFSDNTESPQGC